MFSLNGGRESERERERERERLQTLITIDKQGNKQGIVYRLILILLTCCFKEMLLALRLRLFRSNENIFFFPKLR